MAAGGTDELSPGSVLAGKYRIEGTLGAGGMGVVFAATHLLLQQRVAIKVLLPEASRHEGARARFLREARNAARITSEHVARVVDVAATDDGAPYLVMEHLDGRPLSQELRARGGVPIRAAADMLLEACEAIGEAHTLGIVHRDLKPANLFLTTCADDTRTMKVLDFGLSKAVGSGEGVDSTLTGEGIVAGSPAYMSPEQLRSLKTVDQRTDIWALGVILFEVLTARRPFEAPTKEAVLVAIAADPPTPLDAVLPGAPRGLCELVADCLNKDVARRVPNVVEFARRLAPFGSASAAASFERVVRLTTVAARSSRSDLSAGPALAASPPAVPLLASAPQISFVTCDPATSTGSGSDTPVSAVGEPSNDAPPARVADAGGVASPMRAARGDDLGARFSTTGPVSGQLVARSAANRLPSRAFAGLVAATAVVLAGTIVLGAKLASRANTRELASPTDTASDSDAARNASAPPTVPTAPTGEEIEPPASGSAAPPTTAATASAAAMSSATFGPTSQPRAATDGGRRPPPPTPRKPRERSDRRD